MGWRGGVCSGFTSQSLSACTGLMLQFLRPQHHSANICLTVFIVTLRCHFITAVLQSNFADCLVDSDPSCMMNYSYKDANGEPKDAAVPHGMWHCKDSFL